jgi:hypothetical protein
VLTSAHERQDLDVLWWYVEAQYPRKMMQPGISGHQPAMWPRGFIPVVAAGPDWETQRIWAELLCELFAEGNRGRDITFRPLLTHIDLLNNLRWYEWGDQPEIDHICAECGQIRIGPIDEPQKCDCGEPWTTKPIITLDQLDIIDGVTQANATTAVVAGIVEELTGYNEPGYQPSIDEVAAVLRLRHYLFVADWLHHTMETICST